MHRGRTYPFAPKYWATEAWFWPGFVPWKMHAFYNGFDGPPWDFIPIGWQQNSEEVFFTPDMKEAVYVWFFAGLPPLYGMAVTLVRDDSFGFAQARFAVTLTDTAGLISEAYDYQAFPQRTVQCGGFSSSTPYPPYTYDGTVSMVFRPSTYAEGGSPWL